MATIFKSLLPSDYTITPFPAYYDYRYTYTSGSLANSADVQLLYGSKINTSSVALRTANFEYDLFDSVIQSFYSPLVLAQTGIESTSYTPSGSVWVISISQDLFGNEVVPGTFSLSLLSTSSYDDSKGNLIVSSSGTGSVIGRIFYDKGIVVVKPNTGSLNVLNTDGLRIVSGGALGINFTSSLTIYEHSIRLKLNPNEFLYALNNPTAGSTVVGGTDTAINMMHNKEMVPYVTTIGLYNDLNELLVVAKVSNPIQRTTDVTQTYVVKFDT